MENVIIRLGNPTLRLRLMQTNLVVTAGMLNPANGTVATVLWQIVNQSVNVPIYKAQSIDDRSPSTRPMPTSLLL